MIFTYVDNSNGSGPSSPILFEGSFESILIADKIFEQITGKNPVKCSWIGCRISNIPKGN